MGYMALRKTDEPEALAAGEEFYRRHAEWLYRRLSRASLTRGLGAGIEDLVQETLARAFERAETFKPLAGASEQRDRWRVRAWLSSIAMNLALTNLAVASSELGVLEEIENWYDADSKATEPSPRQGSDTQVESVRSALCQLSERERDILFTSMQYERPGEAHQRLPDDVMHLLEERYGTTAENIRQIRKRARDKIRAFIEADPRARPATLARSPL